MRIKYTEEESIQKILGNGCEWMSCIYCYYNKNMKCEITKEMYYHNRDAKKIKNYINAQELLHKKLRRLQEILKC